MDEQKTIAYNLNAAMKRMGYSQHDLAKLTGYSQAQLSRYLRGVVPIPEWRLEKMAAACNIEIEALHRELLPKENEKCDLEKFLNWLMGKYIVEGDKVYLGSVNGLSTYLRMNEQYTKLLNEPDNDFTENEYNYLMAGQLKRLMREVNNA